MINAREVAQARLRSTYADGLRDGVDMALKSALGESPGHNYKGPELPPEFVGWAREALRRVADDRP